MRIGPCQRSGLARFRALSLRFEQRGSIRNLALHGCINLGLCARAEQEGLHIVQQEGLMIGIDRAQTIMVDELILRRQPGLPASLANFSVNLFAQRAAERRFFQAGQLLLAARTGNDLCHMNAFSLSVEDDENE